MKMTVVLVGRDIIDFYKKFCYNVYVWMTSARALEKGTVVRLDATVKKHEEYQGVKQTHLTRPSIKEVKV
jgi:hypothetical protein